MPTHIATGSALTLEIDGTDVSPQATEVTLELEQQVETYTTLTGKTSKVTGNTGTLNVSMFQDWGAATSFCSSLWDAAVAGDSVAFEFIADGYVFTGNVIPVFPTVGGPADAALEASLAFTVDGDVTKVAD